ncbi:hypothetical protein FM103_19050 [Corynebacterium xerosis]|nr:hypothetical protein FM103_19050 [Corynebacterium xerosis]
MGAAPRPAPPSPMDRRHTSARGPEGGREGGAEIRSRGGSQVAGRNVRSQGGRQVAGWK